MDQREYFASLSRYHVLAHARLLKALTPMSDVEYHADQGLFFRSVHRTLNHLLLVDLLWQGRIAGKPFAMSGLDQELVKERGRLAEEMMGQAETRIRAPSAYLDSEGKRREYPLTLQLAHAFNHATHHRGQVTAVITRLGYESPVLDLPYVLAEDSALQQ
jgi:uncharacterized damage-inducible protein DinB